MTDYVRYVDRPGWDDVVPIEQYENGSPLAPIFYTNEYKDVANYFRGIVKTGEKSERVLELTEHIIRLNPAHYTAWQYRYETLIAIDADLEKELKLMDELAITHLKTYQVWHHRRLLMLKIRKPIPELRFIAKTFLVDAKNYHTWSYRQWLLAYFNDEDLWAGELDFVEQLLYADIRNNSAWHHRFFTVFQSGVHDGEQDRERVLKRELIYVKQSISLVPNNASAWNYLRGVLEQNSIPFSKMITFVQPYTLPMEEQTTDLVDLDNPPPSKTAHLPCALAIEFLADVYEAEGGDSMLKATELWKSLGNEHDVAHKKYWEYRIREGLRVLQT
ncbi:hypothetical protein FB446DRAFT_732465 [Lentinula raphanica]|uniref:Protein farnesyltransferase/geranylgeranyltransferase type-1 subunit alpha n=1 Tax=Lentinula raphanica TaxID=153919 RepID=A0AA38P9B6_9AGAR|nr:hypothetical protein FB446DRAFT_732465 [Lentinula raphanica]KAJ3821835.1 hypothetical protein F5880DRAFT_1614334 [Lentinula raphanica]KAJ3838717.1 hypothetical protein F5878DRAFT_158827 [Lentinula raphanica]